jgi:hypothetical protein
MTKTPPPMIVELVSRGVIALSGPDAKTLLQGIITNDIKRLSQGAAIYAALLTPQGKYLHDFFVTEQGETLFIDCEAARAGDLIRRLTMYRLRAKVDIIDRTSDLAVAAIITGDTSPLGPDAILFPDPRHQNLGFRAILPRSKLSDLPKGEAKDYERLRLELNVPDGAHDFEIEKTLALEGNMEELNGVDFKKGCYVGQELTARTKHRGKVRKRLLAVDIDGPAPAPDTPIYDGEKEIGHMRSSLGSLGMALLRVEDLRPGASYPCGAATLTPRLPAWLKLEGLAS